MNSKIKRHLFSGMGYRELQPSNSSRCQRLSKKEKARLKEQGYKNVGWNNVIELYQKLNDLLLQPAPGEDTLEELFFRADRIGNKHQTSEEIREFNQKLTAKVTKISAQVDRQFPDSEMEFIDYSSTTKQRAAVKRKRR